MFKECDENVGNFKRKLETIKEIEILQLKKFSNCILIIL